MTWLGATVLGLVGACLALALHHWLTPLPPPRPPVDWLDEQP